MNAPQQVGELDRRTYIGGSDAAAILGLAPYEDSTPLTAYLKKTGLLQPSGAEPNEAREKAMRRGKRMEPLVVQMLREDEGVKVTKQSTQEAPNRYVDPLAEFMAAEVDFEWEVTPEAAERFRLPNELIGTVQNGEVKTIHPWGGAQFGEAESDEVPVQFAAQAMHGLMVTGRQLCMFAVLVGSDNLSFYFVRRDEETIENMRGRFMLFWMEHVIPKVPPKPANLPDIFQLFRIKPASITEASQEIVDLVEQLKVANAEKNRIAGDGGVIDELQFQIGRFMLGEEKAKTPSLAPGKHVLTIGGREILAVTQQSARRIDQKLLRKEQPELAEKYERTSSFFVFRPKKGGSK